jgi:hypothetical protein
VREGGMELKWRNRLTMTVLVTYCRASSRKRASVVCWEEAFSAMTVEGGIGAEGSLKWKGELIVEIESENERGKTKATRERRGLMDGEKARPNSKHFEGRSQDHKNTSKLRAPSSLETSS